MNIKYTFLFTNNYDDSKPNNNYLEESDTLICEEGYTIEDYLSDNNCTFKKSNCEGEYILINHLTGEPTGERIFVIKKEQTMEDYD